jgi:hypothetical protein
MARLTDGKLNMDGQDEQDEEETMNAERGTMN